MADNDKYGIVLNRGARYRFRNVVYLRNVPVLVDLEVRDHLVEEAEFFKDIRLDAQGKRIIKKVKPRPVGVKGAVRRYSPGIKAGTPELIDTGVDTGDDAVKKSRAASRRAKAKAARKAAEAKAAGEAAAEAAEAAAEEAEEAAEVAEAAAVEAAEEVDEEVYTEPEESELDEGSEEV